MRGFARVSAAIGVCTVADCRANAAATVELMRKSHEQGDEVLVFPELGLTGYTVRDLFGDSHLLAAALDALSEVIEASRTFTMLTVVGLPLQTALGVFNVAAAVQGGKILGVVPKAYLPNYREFEEARWFRPGGEAASLPELTVLGQRVPFGLDVLFESGDGKLCVGIEVCEDLWVQIPPSAYAVGAGANLICNLSASNFTVGKAELRRLLARSASDRGKCAYLYVAAGPGESSTDLAFDADAFICENGTELVQSRRFAREPQLVTADVDLEFLTHDRIATTTFGDCARANDLEFRRVGFDRAGETPPDLRRLVPRHPFIPADPKLLADRCWEIFEIQCNALATRMQAIGRPKLVLGVSGGLDSTQAALVAAGALDLLDQPRSDLHFVTMPGFGTTAGTQNSAVELGATLGAHFEEIAISEVSAEILALVGHPAADGTDSVEQLLERVAADPALGDVAFENTQARLRTLVLMTIANRVGGIVVGTGDLSEKALGWSTYAGDHISMYDVNAGIPKTLIQSVIGWVANEKSSTWSSAEPDRLRAVLSAVLNTPISPELLPADAAGSIAQLTEDTLGPYELHDFFLYHFVRRGSGPRRILDMARVAFGSDYDVSTLKRWLKRFFGRFFAAQFKRSCTPDGPKVGQVALSPRGDWRMPSDARVGSWLAEVDAYED